ncbi:hypothetical protein TIFTF001_028342 [Ficus carica]|uniref:Uncharacterized protein n=1 Tax=Ficus carica TaxID=3494 RepID=A0AA88IWF2_FICCA|nr:hypothetical protein TIFTF001_028342 [Ficus carica]
MLKLPIEYWDCSVVVPPAVHDCPTWLLCESPVYDGQGLHGGCQTVDVGIYGQILTMIGSKEKYHTVHKVTISGYILAE